MRVDRGFDGDAFEQRCNFGPRRVLDPDDSGIIGDVGSRVLIHAHFDPISFRNELLRVFVICRSLFGRSRNCGTIMICTSYRDSLPCSFHRRGLFPQFPWAHATPRLAASANFPPLESLTWPAWRSGFPQPASCTDADLWGIQTVETLNPEY